MPQTNLEQSNLTSKEAKTKKSKNWLWVLIMMVIISFIIIIVSILTGNLNQQEEQYVEIRARLICLSQSFTGENIDKQNEFIKEADKIVKEYGYDSYYDFVSEYSRYRISVASNLKINKINRAELKRAQEICNFSVNR